MEWILYIIGGFFVLSLLWAIGIIPEFIAMIVMSLIFGCIGGIFFNWDSGFTIGFFVGLGVYGLYCIVRIINPEIYIDIYDDGSSKYHSERGKGIVGLLVLIGSVIYVLVNR